MDNLDKYTEAYKQVITEWLGPSPLFDLAKNGRVEDIEIGHVFGLDDEDRKELEDFKVTAISKDSVEFTRTLADGAKMVLRRDYSSDNSCPWSGKWYYTEDGEDGSFVEAEAADSAKAVQEKLWRAKEDKEEAPGIAEEAAEDSTGAVSITLETMDDPYDADLFARSLEKMGFTCDYNSETASHPSYTISAPADKEAELKSFVLQRWSVGDPGDMEHGLEGVESSFLDYAKNGTSLDFKEAFADKIAESGYEPFDA